jgi:hypothetical protein
MPGEQDDDHHLTEMSEWRVARWMVVVGVVVTLLALAQLVALVTYEDAGQLRPSARTVSATRTVTSSGSSASSAVVA